MRAASRIASRQALISSTLVDHDATFALDISTCDLRLQSVVVPLILSQSDEHSPDSRAGWVYLPDARNASSAFCLPDVLVVSSDRCHSTQASVGPLEDSPSASDGETELPVSRNRTADTARTLLSTELVRSDAIGTRVCSGC